MDRSRAAARCFVAFSILLAVSIPTANAVPMRSYHYQQRMFVQQTSALSDVTDALGVSKYFLLLMHAELYILSHIYM